MKYTVDQLIIEWEQQIASMKYYNYSPEIIDKNEQIRAYLQELKEYKNRNRT